MSADGPIWAVIPAAGSGRRMRAERPKQYLAFQGKTVIEHCLDRLLAHPQIDGAVVVLSEEDRYWNDLAYAAGKPVFTATGGRERQDSVYSGLTTLQFRCGNDPIALIHDAVRVSLQDELVGRRLEHGVEKRSSDSEARLLRQEWLGRARHEDAEAPASATSPAATC